MKTKKNWLVIGVIVATLFVVESWILPDGKQAPAQEPSQDRKVTEAQRFETVGKNDKQPGQRSLLEAEVKMLRASLQKRDATIKELESLIARLSGEVNKLRELCRKNRIEVPKRRTDNLTRRVVFIYLGRPRTGAWFNTMYEKFHEKTARVDGRYIDIGKDVLQRRMVSPDALRGEVYRETHRKCYVLQIIGSHEALIKGHKYSGSGLHMFHVKGLDTKGLVDGADFGGKKLIYCGTYRYVTTNGATKTIRSYMVYTPLTREQFADALAKGFKLTDHYFHPQKNKENKVVSRAIR